MSPIARRTLLSRRTLLKRGAWLAIAGGASLAGGEALGAVLRWGRPADAAARLANALPHGDGAARIGHSALAAGVVRRTRAGLLADLAGRVPDFELLVRDGTDDDLRAALDAARRRDFGDRRTGILRVDGWVVARTEVLACALVALA